MRQILLGLVLLAIPGLVHAQADEPVLSQDVLLMADEGLIGLHLTVTAGGKDVREEWISFLQHTLQQADSDSDGTTTWEELAPRLPGPSEIQFLINGSGGRDIADRRDNPVLSSLRGRATLEGLHQYFASLGFGPLAFRYLPDGIPSPNGISQTAAQQFAGVILFSRLDADRNGQLSKSELADGLTTLQYLDENEDDLLTPVELDSTNRQGTNIRLGGMNGRSTDTGPFLVLPLGDRTGAAIRSLLRRYDRAPARDGVLTPEELGCPAKALSGFDIDQSGGLDRKELAAFLQQPLVRYDVICDLPSGNESATLRVTPRDASDVSPVSERSRITIPLSHLEFGFVGLNRPSSDAPGQVRSWLQRLDRDANDYLDEMELRNFGLQPLFKLVDRDGDGKATADELTVWAETRLGLFGHQFVITASDSRRNLFESLDSNRDGRLSSAEFRRGAEQVSVWDANGDGELTDLEVPQQMTVTFARDLSPLIAQRLGFAGPVASMEQTTREADSSVPAWFAAMDRNSDGEISHQEFVGPLARFSQLDINADGRIDAGEAGR